MKIIDRYIGGELLVTALFAIGVLSLVLVMGNLFKQLLELLVNQDAPLQLIASFIGFILPFSLTYTIPWGFLTSILLLFGKLSAENELVAFKSSGISIVRICVPVAALALTACAICFWINITVAPRAQANMKNTLYRIATNNPLSLFSSDRLIDEFPGKKIYVGRKEGRNLYNLLVHETDERGEPLRIVYAQQAMLETDLENQQILMHLLDAQFEQRDRNNPSDFTHIRDGISMVEGTFPVSLQALYEKNKKRRSNGQMTLEELLKVGNERKTASEASAVRTEINKRFSLALASLAFFLVGVPLAVTAQRKETSVGFIFSLAVAVSFFFFIIVADSCRNNPKFYPHLLMWMPNIIFISLGSVMFYRLARK